MHPPESPLFAAVPREARGLEGSLHDLTNSLAASRSYAEVLRNRARIGALHHPEPVLDDLVNELERMSGIARDVRHRARNEADQTLAWAYEEIFVPAESADALLDLASRESARPNADPVELGEIAARARTHIVRIRALAQRLVPDELPRGADTDLEGLLDRTLDELAPLLDERRAVVVRTSPLPSARADRAAALRVLAALISNAIRHNPQEYPEVEIGGRILPEGQREVWVRDNGPGIPGSVRDSPPPGRGLDAARRAAEAMGAKLSIETPPLGDGTLVRLILRPPRMARKL